MNRLISKIIGQLLVLPKSLHLVWAATSTLTTLWSILIILQGILPVAIVYLTKSVVDSLTIAIANHADSPTSIYNALYLLAGMAFLLIGSAALKALTNLVQVAQSERIKDYVSDKVHAKAVSLDLSFFESPEYHDMLHRATTDSIHRPLSLLQSIGAISKALITLIAMLGVLATYFWWLPIVLAVAAIPALYIALKYSLLQHRIFMRRTSDNRKSYYFASMLTNRESAAEMRLFSLGNYFRKRFRDIRTLLRGEQIQLARRQSIAEFSAALFGLFISGAAIGWVSFRTVTGGGTLGDLALIYQALNQGQSLMQSLLSNVRQLYVNLLFVENLFAFLALTPRLAEPVSPAEKMLQLDDCIELKDITFKYPAAERVSLENFSLTVPAGTFVAIVGENGAGKSTLIKLLTRLYDPQSGKITIDGTDIKTIPLDQVRSLYTALFQTPVKYQQSVSDNISLAQWWQDPTTDDIAKAADGSGANIPINKLPDGYQTLLGKMFGGEELSGGEWQRIALARAFLRTAPVILLDEPTSDMDSWAESDWMERFRSLIAGRTALLITHRFSTAMRADIIHVMDQGRIIESGSHNELLKQNGHYADSWKKQLNTAI